jgi:hypothetical protein
MNGDGAITIRDVGLWFKAPRRDKLCILAIVTGCNARGPPRGAHRLQCACYGQQKLHNLFLRGALARLPKHKPVSHEAGTI